MLPQVGRNTRRVNKRPRTLGVVFAAESYLGYHGEEIFAEEGPKTNIRMVTLLFIAYDQFSTLANSDIHQFEDIVGKKSPLERVGRALHRH